MQEATFWPYYGAVFHLTLANAWAFAKAQGYQWGFVAAIICALIDIWRRRGAAMSAVKTTTEAALSGLLGIAILLVIVFLYHLFQAPIELANKHANEVVERDNSIKTLRQSVADLNNELRDLKGKTQPSLTGKILGLDIGTSSPSKETNPNVFLALQITNAGAPSAVDCCDLTIERGDWRVVGQLHLTPKKLRINIATGQGQYMQFKGDEALYNRVATAIPTGQWQRGWVWFVVPNASFSNVTVPGTVLTVGFKDYLERHYTCSWIMRANRSSEPPMYPAMEQPFNGAWKRH